MQKLLSRPALRSGKPIVLVLILLALTATLGQNILALERETRVVGVIPITADSFVDLGAGQTLAQGNIWLGDHLHMAGGSDSLIFDSATITGTGTLGLIAEGINFVSGTFSASGTNGLAIPAPGATGVLGDLAGFGLAGSPTVSQVDILAGEAQGTATLALALPGGQGTAAVAFTAGPGPSYAGSLPGFGLDVAGVHLAVPAGTTLDGSGISIPSASLSLPSIFGGGITNVDDLHLSPGTLSMAGGAVFALPDLLFGDGSKLKATGNLAALDLDTAAGTYRLAVTSTLVLRLPENQQDIQANLALSTVDGNSQLSGALSDMSLALAGARLSLSGVSAGNDGLAAAQASLTMPASLGGSQTSLHQVRIGGAGLSVGAAGARFPIPELEIGSGEHVSLQSGMAVLNEAGGDYRLDVSGNLVIDLPENQQTVAMAFGLAGGQITGTLSSLSLSVAGTTLKLDDLSLDNTGLAVTQASLTLPSALGGATASVASVRIDDNGLSFGSAGLAVDLPDLAFASNVAGAERTPGLAAPSRAGTGALSLTGNHATLQVTGDGKGYVFSSQGTLHINLPGNLQQRNLSFSLAYDPQAHFLVSARLDALLLDVAGMSLALSNLQMGNSGLSVGSATLTTPATLGGSSLTLSDVTIDGGGLHLGSGRFELPDMSLAGGKLTLGQCYASLSPAGSGYSLSAAGALGIHLPENEQSVDLSFSVDTAGHLNGTLSALSLNMAGTALSLSDVAFDENGLSTASTSIKLPAGLGGATAQLSQVRITSGGLSFANGSASLSLPDMHIGAHLSFNQNAATMSIAGNGDHYVLTAQSVLSLDLPDNHQQQPISFSLARDAAQGYSIQGTLAGLSLDVAGLGLSFQNIALENSGLHVTSATLEVPGDLGGGTVTLQDVSITADGLSLGSGDAEVMLPDVVFGSSIARGGRVHGLASLQAAGATAPLALRGNHAHLTVEGSAYKFSVSSTLYIALPGNQQTSDFTFSIARDGSGYLLDGTLSALSLDIAGSTLRMTNLDLSNVGLSVASATLSLPASLGGSATIDDVRIGSGGLSIGSGSFALPDVVFGGDGSQIKVSQGQASLKVHSGHYALSASGKLLLRLPDNSQDISLDFSIEDGAFSAAVQSLSLHMAGTTLAMQGLDIDNAGLHVASAGITLPASLGGASGTLEGVDITEDGLSLREGKIDLPEVKIGDGSKLKLTNISADLAMAGGRYTLLASGTLNINLPDNAQNVNITFKLDADGNMSADIDQLVLRVAGSSLTMQGMVLSNSGLAVSAATLQLPASLGNASGTLDNVRITADGLSIGGGSFSLPDILIGDGSKLRLNDPSATLSAIAGGYRFDVAATLQLRLPENSQDVAINVSIDTDGQMAGQLDHLTLQMASVSLQLSQVSFNNSGLAVSQGTLQLPASLGGGSGIITNVAITGDGLSIGGGGATFPFPDFKMGDSAGFSVTGVQAGLALAGDHTYKLTLSGTVHVQVPGSAATATGSLSVDNRGNLSGSVSAFSLTVAGLELSASDVSISGSTLSVGSASLNVPAEWGGLSAALYNVVIGPSGVTIGGGAFSLPDIEAGGFTVKDVQGSLQNMGAGYQISAGGMFGVPGLGGGDSCGLGVDLTVFTSLTSELTMQIRPQPQPVKGYIATGTDPAIQGPQRTDSFQLRDVRVALSGCRIPIGETGFSLTRAEGEVSLASGSTRVSLGVSVASDLQVMGSAALRGDVDMSLATNPWEFGLTGSLYVFVFHAGGLDAHINEADGFKATLWIEAIVARGQFTVHAWSHSGKFHLTGSATVEIGIPKGEIWQGCIPYPCCTAGCKWHCHWYGCYPSCWVHCSWCQTCVTVPPSDWTLGNVNADFGEFRTSGGSAYGFKGWVSVLGYDAGFYVDGDGTLAIGNVDKYQLVDSYQVQQARELWQAAQRAGESSANQAWEYDGIRLASGGDVYMTVPITQTTDVVFSLSRNGSLPGFTLIDPQGNEITPENLPANVTYTVSPTRTVGIPVAVVQAASGDAGAMPDGLDQTAALIDAARTAAWLGDAPLPAGDGVAQPYLVEPLGNTCGLRPALPTTVSGIQDPQHARVRLVHAAPGAGPVNLQLSGPLMLGSAAFGQVGTYVAVQPGAYSADVIDAGSSQVITGGLSLQLEAGQDYSLVFTGQPGSEQLLALADDNSLPATGKARLRFVQAAPGLAPVDVVTRGGPALFLGAAFPSASGYQVLDAGATNLEVRPSDTLSALLALPPADLADGAIYTVWVIGRPGGTPGLQAVVSLDAVRPARLRAVNASPDAPPLDVLVDGSAIFSSVPYSETTEYATLTPGHHDLAVVAAGSGGPALIQSTLNVLTDTDYSLALVGPLAGVQSLVLVDDNSAPEMGQTALRFVQLSPAATAVDVATTGGQTLAGGLTYQAASDYLHLPAGSYDLVYRVSVTDTHAITTPAVALMDGTVSTVFLMGLGGESAAMSPVIDTTYRTITQVQFTVDQARPGTWLVHLSGDTSADDHYLVSILGSDPPPSLSEVSATGSDGQSAQVSWRLRSEDPGTTVDVYASLGPITATRVITESDGLAHTVVLPVYTGVEVASGLTGAQDGTPTGQLADLSQLESGRYWIWLEAEDGRNPPVRIYAPEPVQVAQPWPSASAAGASASAPAWDPDIEITPGYRRLQVRWDRYTHPDIDGYVVHLGTTPLSAARAITVGDVTGLTLSALDPGRTYYLSVEAMDDDTGRSVRSAEAAATPLAAPFELVAGSPSIDVAGGGQAQVALTLRTSLPAYPAPVSLSAGCAEPWTRTIYLPMIFNRGFAGSGASVDGVQAGTANCLLVDGIDVAFPTTQVTPSLEGTTVVVVVQATETLAGGTYHVPITAQGGGVTQTLDLLVTVAEPRFTLQAAAANDLLGQNASTSVLVGALGTNGENDEIHLDLSGAPAGLQWRFDNEIIMPGGRATLVITDTPISGPGTYVMEIIGEDGEHIESAAVTVRISEPTFQILPEQDTVEVAAGGAAVYTLDLEAGPEWSGPVTLRLDDGSLPFQVTAGFVAAPSGASAMGQGAQAEIELTPPDRTYLVLAANHYTPAGQYVFRVLGAGPGYAGSRELKLMVRAPGHALNGPVLALPMIARP